MSVKINSDRIIDWYGYTRNLVPSLIRKPLGYFFYLTGRCNLSCEYCWQRKIPKQERALENKKTNTNELAGEEWSKIIKSLPKLSFVGLTGGEPLLYSNFENIVNQLGGCFSFTINTNGALLNDEIIENLIKNKASNLSISLDGFANVHDVSRNKVGLFDKIVERIDHLNFLKEKKRAKKPYLTIKTVLLDSVLDRLEEFYRFCDETLKADCLNISLMITTESRQQDLKIYENLKELTNDIGVPKCYSYSAKYRIPEILERLLEYSLKRRCKILLYPRMYNRSSIERLIKAEGQGVFGPCYIPWSYIVILSDGTLIPCLPIRLGNIREINYDVCKLAELDKYQEFLQWRSLMNYKKRSPAECNMCCFSTVQVK